jgi:PAB-dependent poly(A)-specific ribonuclease subunit 3
MSDHDPGQLGDSSYSHAFAPSRNITSDSAIESPYQDKGTTLPTIQPTPPNKGATSHTSTANCPTLSPIAPAHTHANVTASSGSSTTESLSELTSQSSLDSIPTAHTRGDTTPQKAPRSNRRSKSGKTTARWSKGGCLDETALDCTPPTSQPSEAALNAAQSPTPVSKQRQPHSANRVPAAKQGRLMATTFGSPSGDSRRGVASPRPKGRGMKTVSNEHHWRLTQHCRSEEYLLS